MSVILKAKDSQFRLSEDGSVSFQVQESNPLPGDVVAVLQKGETPLTPTFQIKDAKDADEAALVERLEQWRDAHIGTILELLVGLKQPLPAPKPAADTPKAADKVEGEIIKEGEASDQIAMNFDTSAPESTPEKTEEKTAESAETSIPKEADKPLVISETVSQILDAVYESMGILPREKLEGLIAKLDVDDRRVLRMKRVRLGPILVFIPALNKPAGVRLRAMLWSLYHDQPLPAQVPNDGMVSQVVDAEAVNKDFYQAIGYPVFGNRAIRIDMLDRVICAVYDSADKGKFRAQHQMAEWLGCPIDDLYGILSAMGHRKVEVQADAGEAYDAPVVDAVVAEDAGDKPAEGGEGEAAVDAVATKVKVDDVKTENVKTDVKPELAEFYLKRGKAFEKSGGNKRPFKKGGFKGNAQDGKNRDQKPKFDKKKGKRNKSENRSPKVISAPAKKVEDSPFAILEQLKK